MMYLAPYCTLAINLLIIWFMPKRLTRKEIYVSWFVIALINLSTDLILDFYFKLYRLGGPGVELSVHVIELTLGASFGIIFLNFMPGKFKSFLVYMLIWLGFSLAFESFMVRVDFINFTGWQAWYSIPYYIAAFFFVRWHLFYIRKGN